MSGAEWSALALSVRVAALAVVVGGVPGLALAWLLARRSFPGKWLVNALVHLPLVLPPVAVGYGLLLLLGKKGLIGQPLATLFGVSIPFTWVAAVVASAVMGFPLFVRTVRVGFEAVDPEIEDAARTLGAGPWDVLRNVTLPLALPSVWAGGILAFARSFGEFGATAIVAGNVPGETRTVPLALYSLVQSPQGEAAALRLLALSVFVSLAAVGVSEWFVRRRRGEKA